MTRKEIIGMSDSKVNSMVKIAGTNYDRRIKVTESMAKKMKSMFKNNKSYAEIAEYFDVHPDTVRRHIDESYAKSERTRKYVSAKLHGWYHGESNESERANYKRELLNSRKKLVIAN